MTEPETTPRRGRPARLADRDLYFDTESSVFYWVEWS